MKTLLFAGAAVALAFPAMAQDHDHTADRPPMPDQMPATAEPAPMDHSMTGNCPMDHAAMDHGNMDQCSMDHGAMDHGAMDHGAMDHSMAGMAMGHDMAGMASGPAEGSGTSRLPQAEGMMPGVHFDLGGGWQGMAHGFANLVHTDQSGPRGDDKTYVQSMAMLMVERRWDGARLQLRSMMSAEPLMAARGYPNLFATGETADGEPLVDRQHPHDLFMELAARVDVNIAPDTTVFVYGGPVGEPALGPSAFMHRASAGMNPEAPITHHWFDSTHITYGVVTGGVANKLWQVEASAFRGAEPDEERWGIETPRLDSWSVRATLTPTPNWALQVSHGRMQEPEALHPGEDEARTTASVQYHSDRGDNGGSLSAMAAFSAKNRVPGDTLTAWLGEVNWDLDRHHTLFGRLENVANDELFHDHADPLHDMTFRITKLQAGYAYTLPLGQTFALSLGGSGSLFLTPSVLDAPYGNNPTGVTAFARLTLGGRD